MSGTAAAAAKVETLVVTLRRSLIGKSWKHRVTAKALGLKYITQTRELPNNPQVRGSLNKIAHLLHVKLKSEHEAAKAAKAAAFAGLPPVTMDHH